MLFTISLHFTVEKDTMNMCTIFHCRFCTFEFSRGFAIALPFMVLQFIHLALKNKKIKKTMTTIFGDIFCIFPFVFFFIHLSRTEDTKNFAILMNEQLANNTAKIWKWEKIVQVCFVFVTFSICSMSFTQRQRNMRPKKKEIILNIEKDARTRK